ncbi:MAG: hypothetical protein QG656_553, partial [Candidatus Hydrogenedentes bacterium]|nr:hypothetical protein [Candidatus Hydrogenedentota bacterium]
IRILTGVVVLFAAFACVAQEALPARWTEADGNSISVLNGRFCDQHGRQVLLRGVNVDEKSRGAGYIGWQTAFDYERLGEWGFNCIRFCIFWDGVEPECGKYDDAYLAKVDERIAWAKKNGIFVILDMHQDLWGPKIPGADGAPAWATLDDDKPHATGVVWSDAYYLSQQVQRAFDNFWANKPGPDGVGIQDRFALAWQHVAQRYANEPAVVGFDILNEPSSGSAILGAPIALLPHVMKIFGTDANGQSIGIVDLISRFLDDSKRSEMLAKLDDIEVFRTVVDALAPVFLTHERTQLQPMYQRVADAIRKVDRRHILFIEPQSASNVGVRSELQPVLGADGQPDPQQALAPHAYDLTTDTPNVDKTSSARVEFILSRAVEHGKAVGLPVLIGEWGAYYGSDKAVPVARAMAGLLDRFQLSNTYWSHGRKMNELVFFDALSHPYPASTAGAATEFTYDFETGAFHGKWVEDPSMQVPTRIYLPKRCYPNGYEVEVKPSGRGYGAQALPGNEGNEYLAILPTGDLDDREIAVTRK